ncbi:M28 family peptidase [Pseudonocardia saturnea]
MTGTDRTRRSRVLVGLTAGLLAVAGTMVAVTPAAAAPPGCDNRNNNTVAKLLDCVTVEGVRAHQQALQGIADANGGNRASGLPGYTASADYVAAQAAAAGLAVTRQQFDFPFFQLNSSSFAQVAPAPATYAVDVDYIPMTYTGATPAGGITATVQAVDVVLPPTPTPSSTSGCEAADFAGFAPGTIALLQRGTCTFGEKVDNAVAAGAVGVIIFNEGQPGRTDTLAGTLGAPKAIPVIGTNFALGQTLGGATVTITIDAISEIRQTENVFAEIRGGRTADNVVMVGAHLDSVTEGPGINDNGSGSAAILEVAKLIAKSKPTNTVRFAWWGAEELGLLGSQAYVDSLSAAELDRIALYLNFDMVGSPNFARFVYDGDQSTFPEDLVPIPDGSAAIEDVFEKFYADRGLAFEDTAFDGRSDYEAFALANIPAGGLFTGAEGLKTPAQVALYGGTAGEAYDPCYHQACDNFGNNSDEVLGQNADAIAYATLTLAYDTALVNGVAGRPAPGSARDSASGGQAAA